jgi:hypothetical protein
MAVALLVAGDRAECRTVNDDSGRAEAVDVDVAQSAGHYGWW